MSAHYFGEMNIASASTTLAVGSLTTGGRRIWIYDFLFGSEASPAADNPFLWVVDRISTASTGSSVVEEFLDGADIAATGVMLETHTTNGTVGNRTFSCPLNQRASFRWVMAPGGALVIATTANAALAWRTPTSTAIAVTAGAYWEE